MAINTELLALRFQNATNCTSQKAQALTKQYITLCALQVMRHVSKDAGHRFYIDQTHLQNTLNTIMVDGQRHYVWKTFQTFPERIFNIVETGSNITEKLSMAELNYKMEELLLAAGTPEELAIELYKPYNEQIQRDEFDSVPIDMRSLGNYIKSNLSQDRESKKVSTALREDLDRNLKHAQRILMLASANDNQLIQIHSPSAFGRKYYKGPNLQNTPKVVRHAALGTCHEYDIESSVFAWKLSWFQEICRRGEDRISMPATLEYLDHKQAIRKKLAEAVFGTNSPWAIDIVKEFITAIGFGAPARAQGYKVENRYQRPALATIIYPKQRLDTALADSWVKEFIEEQKKMNTVIVGYGQITDQEPTWRLVPELLDKGNRLRPNSVVAYLYQQHERKMLDWAEEFCADKQILLTVHDCIYTRHAVNLSEFRSGILGFGQYFRLNHEHHRAWSWEDPVDQNDPFYDPRETIVQQRLEKFESTAEVYTGAGHDGTQEYNFEDDPFYNE